MYCTKCGHIVDEGYDFCKNCGAKINKGNRLNTFPKPIVDGKMIARIGLYVFSWVIVVIVTALLVFCPMVKIKETKELRKALVSKYGSSGLTMDLSEYSYTEPEIVKETFDIVSYAKSRNEFIKKIEADTGRATGETINTVPIICVTILLVIVAVVVCAFAVQGILGLIRYDRVMIVDKCRGFAVSSVILLIVTFIWTKIYNGCIADVLNNESNLRCSAGLYILIIILVIYATVGLMKYNDLQYEAEKKKLK